MKVGELFINIGLAGATKVGQSLGQVRNWMSEVGSTSLETKAAIAGVVFGLEHFMSRSAQLGMSLQQFSNFTGLSIDSLQRWQIAGKQAGVSAEEMESSIKGIQKAIAEIQLGHGPPGGFPMIARYAGGIDINKLNDTYYVLEKIQKFAQNKEVPRPFANYFMQQAHLSDNMIQFLRTSKIGSPGKVDSSLINTDAQVKQLAKVSVAWDMLGLKMQRAWDKLTAKHGIQVVSDLSKITDQIVKMVSALSTLAEKLKIFKLLGMVFEGWSDIFQLMNETIDNVINTVDQLSGNSKEPQVKEKPVLSDEMVMPDLFSLIKPLASMVLQNNVAPNEKPKSASNPPMQMGATFSKPSETAVPNVSNAHSTTNSTQINQTITHYGNAEDTKAVKDLHGMAGREASRILRTSPAPMRAN